MPESDGRPRAVVYGWSAHFGSWCVGPDEEVRALAAEVDAVKRATTYAEALALDLQLTWAPGVPDAAAELAEDGIELTDGYDWSAQAAVEDGDWPPMPVTLLAETFNDEDEAWVIFERLGLKEATTVLNGEYLSLDAREDALTAALDELGVAHRRDDDLFAVLEP